jgi:hypothetical protein
MAGAFRVMFVGFILLSGFAVRVAARPLEDATAAIERANTQPPIRFCARSPSKGTLTACITAVWAWLETMLRLQTRHCAAYSKCYRVSGVRGASKDTCYAAGLGHSISLIATLHPSVFRNSPANRKSNKKVRN